MNSYSFTKIPAHDVDDLKRAYRQSLTAPLDGMWEHFTGAAGHHIIKSGTRVLGYCAVTAEQKLLQFSVEDDADARRIFAEMLADLNIKGAILASFETRAAALCMDQQKSVAVNAYLYHLPSAKQPEAASFPKGDTFKPVVGDAKAAAVAFAAATLGMGEDWLKGYFGDLIQKKQLYALWRAGKIIATGECRLSQSQKPFADVGMVVGQECRRQGIATNILCALIRKCEDEGLKAICSTESGNIPAQRAIARAGFICHHRMLEFVF